jgi:acetolactate synthase regulatory subunit
MAARLSSAQTCGFVIADRKWTRVRDAASGTPVARAGHGSESVIPRRNLRKQFRPLGSECLSGTTMKEHEMQEIESSQLVIHMSRAYGSLNRLIGIVRQRCFEIESMNVQSESSDHYRIQMVVVSERSIVHLLKKISQMADVTSVSASKLTQVMETA